MRVRAHFPAFHPGAGMVSCRSVLKGFLPLRERAGFRPAGGLLSFAGPNESNQSKGPEYDLARALGCYLSRSLGRRVHRLVSSRTLRRCAASWTSLLGVGLSRIAEGGPATRLAR